MACREWIIQVSIDGEQSVIESPIIPGPRKEVREIVPFAIRQEQIEKEQKDDWRPPYIERMHHDPLWQTRFWSIQHVHDVIEGNTFHWFWSPMKEVFSLSQIMFMLMPFIIYLKSGGNLSISQIILWVLTFKCLVAAIRYGLEAFHEWHFRHVWKKARNRHAL
jgi:hypothetical protein